MVLKHLNMKPRSLLSIFFLLIGFAIFWPTLSSAQEALTITPNPVAFGDVPAGDTGGPITLTVTRTSGIGVVKIGTISFGDPTNFAVSTDNCSNTTLNNPNPSCTLAVTFTPSIVGLYTDFLLILQT